MLVNSKGMSVIMVLILTSILGVSMIAAMRMIDHGNSQNSILQSKVSAYLMQTELAFRLQNRWTCSKYLKLQSPLAATNDPNNPFPATVTLPSISLPSGARMTASAPFVGPDSTVDLYPGLKIKSLGLASVQSAGSPNLFVADVVMQSYLDTSLLMGQTVQKPRVLFQIGVLTDGGTNVLSCGGGVGGTPSWTKTPQ